MEVKAFLRKMMKYRQWNKLQETDDDYRWLYEMFNPHDWKVTLKSHNNLRALKLAKTLKAISPVASSPTYMYTRTLNNRLCQACRSNALSQCLVRKCFRNKGETNISRYSTRTIFFFKITHLEKKVWKCLNVFLLRDHFPSFIHLELIKWILSQNIIADFSEQNCASTLHLTLPVGMPSYFDSHLILRGLQGKSRWNQLENKSISLCFKLLWKWDNRNSFNFFIWKCSI